MKQAQPRQDLGKRTKDFALRIIRMYVAMPKTTGAQVIGKLDDDFISFSG
jgi:hypothetical protein